MSNSYLNFGNQNPLENELYDKAFKQVMRELVKTKYSLAEKKVICINPDNYNRFIVIFSDICGIRPYLTTTWSLIIVPFLRYYGYKNFHIGDYIILVRHDFISNSQLSFLENYSKDHKQDLFEVLYSILGHSEKDKDIIEITIGALGLMTFKTSFQNET